MISELNLDYVSEGQWRRIPEWAEFLISIGYEVAMLSEKDERWPCVGLVLPTQAYAAAFVALGVLRFSVEGREKESTSEHFDTLFNLRKGTYVRILEGDKCRRGTITDFEQIGSQRRLQIAMSLPKGVKMKRWYKPEESDKIQAISENKIMAMSGRRVHRLAKNLPFVASFLGDHNIKGFGMVSTLDCLVVSHPGRFRREVTEAIFGIRNNHRIYKGNLHELLRVKEFMQRDHAYHTSVISPRSRNMVDTASSRLPLVTIYDGLSGILRLRDSLSSSGWVFLTDRSAPNADEATTFLTQAYLRRSGDISLQSKASPAGIETICFWR